MRLVQLPLPEWLLLASGPANGRQHSRRPPVAAVSHRSCHKKAGTALTGWHTPQQQEQQQQQQHSPYSSRRGFLLGAPLVLCWPRGVQAEELQLSIPTPSSSTDSSSAASGAKQAYFDFTVDGKPAGRVVVELFEDVQLGSHRFADLVRGVQGVGFRRTRINLLQDGFIQCAGVKSLSYSGSGRVLIAGGEELDVLEDELAQQKHSHDRPGMVSLVVRNSKERVSKDKLVAMNGQLVTVTETFGELPNGTAFAITTRPQPDLDGTNLVVGQLVSGAEVVERLAALPRVKDNSDSPFFKAGKLSGDKRADVAERAFGKPFARIFVAECGFL